MSVRVDERRGTLRVRERKLQFLGVARGCDGGGGRVSEFGV